VWNLNSTSMSQQEYIVSTVSLPEKSIQMVRFVEIANGGTNYI